MGVVTSHVIFLIDTLNNKVPYTDFIDEVKDRLGPIACFSIYSTNGQKILSHNQVVYSNRKKRNPQSLNSINMCIDEVGDFYSSRSFAVPIGRTLIFYISASQADDGYKGNLEELQNKVSEQYYKYSWRFGVIGQDADRIGDELGLYSYMSKEMNNIMTEENINATVDYIRDFVQYGDAGFKLEIR